MEIKRKKPTLELTNVVNYMTSVLIHEFPTDLIAPEYLVLSILDNKNNHAHMILESILNEQTMGELVNLFSSVMQDHSKPQLKSERPMFKPELERLFSAANDEATRGNSELMGTEHVLLSILKKENRFGLWKVFDEFGIKYDFVFEKCNNKKNEFNRNMDIPIKGMINQTAMVDSTSNAVKQFTININELARNGEVDKIVGRKKETLEIIKILSRRKKNNVVLVGNGGVGKTAVVYNLAKMIEEGEAPEVMAGKEIVMLNHMALMSGTHFRGILEDRMGKLIKELESSGKYILFIDDIQNVLKSGGKDKDSDISGLIGDLLSGGKVRVIGTCLFKEYRNAIESNSSLSRKFQKIVIEPNTKEETFEILNSIKQYYEQFHNVFYPDNVIRKIIDLSQRYVSDRFLPDSAIDILDLAGANTVLVESTPSELRDLKARIKDINDEKLRLLNHGEFEEVDRLNKEENEISAKIAEFKRNLVGEEKVTEITEDDVAKVVSELTGIPVNKLSVDEKAKLANIENVLKESVIGQDEAIDEICKTIKRNRVGLSNKSKPIGTFLLVGNSGVGKTMLAKKIAEEVFGDENAIIRIDMSEYSEKNSVAKLHGCFTPEMNVLMSDGSYKRICDVNIGDYVITHNGNIKQVTNKFEYFIDEKIKNINVSNTNFGIRCTNGHNILAISPKYETSGRFDKTAYSSENASFTPADRLGKDHVLLYPRNIEYNEEEKTFDLTGFIGNPRSSKYNDEFIFTSNGDKSVKRFVNFDKRLARLLGYYVSEGGIHKSYKSITFTFNSEEKEYIDEVINLMSEIFGLSTFSTKNRQDRHSTSITFYSRVVAKLLSNLCGRECHVKRVPLELFKSPKDVKINFLETALYGDGTKCMLKQTKYTTVSLTLASQINTLFRSIGYSTQFVREENQNKKWSTTYRVILTGLNIEKLNEEFPSLRIKSNEIKPIGIHRKYWIDDENYYYRITEVCDEHYCGLVYDLTIDGDSSYIVNGFSVHNSSPGYIGFENGGQLTEAVKHKQHCVLLLDEIEKADQEVYNVFLQLFDEGRMTDGAGQTVNFKNVIIFMTSNVGTKVASEFGHSIGFNSNTEQNKRSIIEKEIKKKFSPEFINRINKIIYFNNLTEDNLKNIVKLELNKFNNKLKDIKYSISYSDDVVSYIHAEAIKEKEYGARPISRIIENSIEDEITELMITNNYQENHIFSASVIGDKISIV